jgi:hypothetical protein
MDLIKSHRATAKELVTLARQRGIDLEPVLDDIIFQGNRRWVLFWRKQDGPPPGGPADEAEATLHYNMQGAISVLPSNLKASAGAFQGVWCETGTFENLEQAFEFLKAWLIDRKEVDELPSRSVSRWEI